MPGSNRKQKGGSAAWLLAAAGTLLTASTAGAAQLYVWRATPNIGAGTVGSSWNKAYTELYDALSAASPGDEIWVAEGTYKPFPSPARAMSFELKSNVKLYGGFSGTELLLDERDPEANPTILSGDHGDNDDAGIFTDNAYTVIQAWNLTSSAYIDGFTITGGRSDGFTGHQQNGGALHVYNANVRLYDSRVEDNSAQQFGGAVYVTGDSQVTVRRTTFEDNSASTGGGGAIYVDESQDDNVRSRVLVERSRFHGNVARWGGAIDDRGGLSVYSSLFSGNTATEHGGAIYAEQFGSTSLYIANATIADNEAVGGYGGGLYGASSSSSYEVYNSILRDNLAGLTMRSPQVQIHPLHMCTVEHCDIQDLHAPLIAAPCDWTDPSRDNFDADPLFSDPAGVDGLVGTSDDDYSINRLLSPCVDAGDNAFYPYGYPLFMDEDLAGNDRIRPGAFAAASIIDVGAYEMPTLTPRLPGDWNADGRVDVTDLLEFLGEWFTTSMTSDVNGDLRVDIQDLLLFLADWFGSV